MEYTKWVACWGNGTSITDQREAGYAKELTLRYPIRICFSGSALRLRFGNFTGRQPVTLQASVAKSIGERRILPETARDVTVAGEKSFTILPGQEVTSDPLPFDVEAGETVAVSLYLADYTDMNAGVLVTGPLSQGYYTYGSYAGAADLPVELTRNTNWFYFLNTIDVLTEEKNRALVCFGDSITAQSWPDYLAIRAWEEGFRDVSVIRRAVSGTRILRQYNCTTYAAYGLKGAVRFPLEINTAGADRVIIQHGINDIIHPVGRDVNIFRPMEDLPTVEEMARGVEEIYIRQARERQMQVWGGTLLPILGWRTYADFREDMKNAFNRWLRTTDALDGCVDFDAAVRDPADPRAFAPGFDSGDHLHPSEVAYKRMAEEVPECLLR